MTNDELIISMQEEKNALAGNIHRLQRSAGLIDAGCHQASFDAVTAERLTAMKAYYSALNKSLLFLEFGGKQPCTE